MTIPFLARAPQQTSFLVNMLAVACTFGATAVLRHHRMSPRVLDVSAKWVEAIVPRIFAITVFASGVILLVSGATPAQAGRLGWVNDFLPVPIIEISAYFASVAGICLILLARGLQRRLDAAYHVTIWVLVAGATFALTSAADWGQAALLLLMLIALLPSRRYFYRRASLFEERFTLRWIGAIAAVVVGTIVLTFLGYGPGALSTQVFWRFAVDAQAPRAVRAITIAVVALVMIALARLLRPARVTPVLAQGDATAVAEPIVASARNSSANLVFLGDKSIMMNEPGTAFIMYGAAGQSWVSLGDPVGSVPDCVGLIHRFVDECDKSGRWPVFYRVGPQMLYLYLDYGFAVAKLGEVARVTLPTFSLDGPERRNLRRVWRKAVDTGCTFEVVAPSDVPPLLPQLRQISDEWLESKSAREKRFSLGRFDESFVSRFPTAIVRCNGKIVAFGTGWPAGDHAEIEIDLMRYSNDAPSGIMRYLLIEFMLWAKREGYGAFNLGMAPLSGIKVSSVTPLWNQIMSTVRGMGERFYNFQGLREFKDWFYPEWEPSYLVSPGGAKRPIVLANIASLISGGVVGTIRR